MIDTPKPSHPEQQRKFELDTTTALALHTGLLKLPDIGLAVRVLELTARTMGRPPFPAEVNRATRATIASQTFPENQQQAEILADCMAIIFNAELYYPILRRDNETVAREKFGIMNRIRTYRGMTTNELREALALDIAQRDVESGALNEDSEVPSLLEQLLWNKSPTASMDMNRTLALTRETWDQLITKATETEEIPTTPAK